MKKQLRQFLSLLCVLALALGCLSSAALAEAPSEETTQYESRIISVEWMDSDDYDGIRPDHVDVSLAGNNRELNASNNWTAEVSVPKGTAMEWSITVPEGYSIGSPSFSELTVVRLSHAATPAISVSASVVWEDSDNIGGIRPESVTLALLADGEFCGEPVSVRAPEWKATWSGLRKYRRGTDTAVVYTAQQLQAPTGYSASASGLQVTNTLELATLSLTATVAGAPEGTDLSALNLTVTGPDPSMPRTLTYGDLSGGTYSFGNVLPGAYLVRNTNADQLVEGYVMDPENSRVADAVYVRAGESATLEFKYTYKLPEDYEVEEGYDPLADVGRLTFEILGPDPRMPITLTYAEFTNGRYELPDLVPGVYTVVERNAETLVKYYTLTSDSITGLTITVSAEGSTTARLFNQYTPAQTPEPDAEFVDIPVTKTWNDNSDQDGNRPDSITARLYADGVEVDNHVLTAAEGWSYTFVDKPRYQEDNRTEIVYTVNEDAVPMYSVAINGYNLVNTYEPELTSVSVTKIWRDNNNEQGIRPSSIAMTLTNGQTVVTVVILNEANGWSATVNNLPTVVNGQPAQYGWTEQEVLGYTLEGVQQHGSTMTFTNATWTRPETPTTGGTPKTAGSPTYVFEDYDTPLGVEIVINHVGDCFD